MPRRSKDPTGQEKLTERERRFVEGRAQGKSVSQAALDAGYSAKTAHQIGYENLKKPEICAAIEKAREELYAQTRVDAREAHGRLALSLRGDLADVLPDDPLLQKAREAGVSKLIKKLKRRPTKYGESIEIELYSAHEAVDRLADIEGWKKQAALNPEDAERRRQFWQQQIEKVKEKKRLDDEAAREWLLENVPAAQKEREWLN